MYHTIVSNVARSNFEKINNQDFDGVLAGVRDDIHHSFGGSHALGGKRTGKDAFLRWMQRLSRLAPQLKLTVTDVWVKGWPWDTTIIARWTAVDPSFTFPDGRAYQNHSVHVIRMSWGKAWDIDANENSQIVAEMLAVKEGLGIEEASMAPVI